MAAMTLKLDATGQDDANARYLARACQIAYKPADAGVPEFRSALGLDAKLISVDHTQVYVGTNSGAIVVAFRGSEAPNTLDGLKDWLLTNALNLLTVPEGRAGTDFAAAGVGARFHSGFLAALDQVWEPLLAAVEAAMRESERPLFVTGHSLGGAVALLASWRFLRAFVPVHQVYTFGAPMIGNDAAAAAFQRELPGKIFRYIDAPDPVPLLPTVSLVANSYEHCQLEVSVADPSAPPAGSSLAALAGGAGAIASGILNATLIDEVWGLVQQRISSHMIENYLERIAKRLNV
jgi:hypothetical protein